MCIRDRFDDVELPDEEAKIVGSWQFDGGSEIWYWYLRLDADGRFYTSDIAGAQPYHGTWSVVQTLEDSNLYWSGKARVPTIVLRLSLIHISEPTLHRRHDLPLRNGV